MANPTHLAKLAEGVDAWNSWMQINSSRKRKVTPDISGARIYGAVFGNLRQSTFSNPEFYSARERRRRLMPDMFQVDLSGANFEGANLSGTEFYEPNFSGVNFKDAFIENAYLYGAKFIGANFDNTSLCGTNLSRAYFKETFLINTNLRDAIGLESTTHTGASKVDLRTLATLTDLPEVFLRGCGLSEWEIEATKLYRSPKPKDLIAIAHKIMELRSPNSTQYYSCFISYSHADAAFAQKLHDVLQDKGVRCWLDLHQILPGDDFYEQIDRGISLWDKTLLCCSADSLSSWWVDNEIDTTFQKERVIMRDRNKKVLSLIPLDLDGYIFSQDWKNGKKQQVKSRMAADFTDWEKNKEKFDRQVERILLALRTDEHNRELPPTSLL